MSVMTTQGPLFRRALREWAQSEGVIWIFIFKALLSVFIALWVAYRLELPQPGTVVVTVFIVMQRQSGEVLAKSFYRIIGTLLGLTLMVTLIALFNQERVLFLLCLALWVGLCTAGAARYRDFRGYACVLAGYTAIMIGLPASLHPEEAFMQALWRVVEITVGILCTGLVSGLILPQTSSATLRATSNSRLRDFARFARSGLSGQLEPLEVEQSHARFAAQAVSLENLRNASAFEDPRIRVRSGRLARMNNEFMVVSTRYHALYQLVQRLQATPEGQVVVDILQPCLDDISTALAPLAEHLLMDSEAAAQAARLDQCKRDLMPQIREGRQQLSMKGASDSLILDYNTAAELLFRFLDDLHNYTLTQASLVQHQHEREQWQYSFTPRANGVAAAVAGVRCALLVLGLSAFWIATAWPSGPTSVLTVGLISALTSISGNPGRLASQIFWGATLSGILGFFLYFWIYPQIDGFPLLYCSFVPILTLGTFWLARPQTAGYGVGLLIWFCILSLPNNLTLYNPALFLNNYLAAILSIAIAALASTFILPPNQPWLWGRLEQDLRMRVVFAVSGKLRGMIAGFESGTRDLLNQGYALAAGRPDVQKRLMRWMFTVLEIGHAVIELREEQARLPKEPWYGEDTEWRLSVRVLGRSLVRLFIQPDAENHQRALNAVEQAIVAVRETPEPRPPQFDSSPLRRVLSYLHFIRSSLLDPNSPLAEGSSTTAGRSHLAS
ncbi:putative membrane protein YccC [Azomonas agilis]|uniref:Putative membrane protein YccC n=1 Tax=Azomonas agilis TaxID=116849 RepID=A0A562J2U0_9GAMM|nr:FUSC family protein [Azomonas agilis]TWH77115.1 putative membrane protein YccC [Azomonas agilis]